MAKKTFENLKLKHQWLFNEKKKSCNMSLFLPTQSLNGLDVRGWRRRVWKRRRATI